VYAPPTVSRKAMSQLNKMLKTTGNSSKGLNLRGRGKGEAADEGIASVHQF
jgi:hypothetical protein